MAAFLFCTLLQHQTEIGEKSTKSETTPLGWAFAIWKLFDFFIHIFIQK